MAKLIQIKARVQLTEDSEPYEVTIGQPDYVMYDMTSGKEKWPGTDKAPFLFISFCAWHCSKRRGLLTGDWLKWSYWVTNCEMVTQAEEETEAVDPTQPAPPVD